MLGKHLNIGKRKLHTTVSLVFWPRFKTLLNLAAYLSKRRKAKPRNCNTVTSVDFTISVGKGLNAYAELEKEQVQERRPWHGFQ